MQLPKYRAEKKKRVKYCQYAACGKEFIGVHVQKYCDFHTDPHNRKRIRPKREDPGVRNNIFSHGFAGRVNAVFCCALSGCGREFAVSLYPGQKIYPKFCENHRSEFRRWNFTRMLHNS